MQDFPTTIGQLKHCTTGLVLSPKAAQIIQICIIVSFGCFFLSIRCPKQLLFAGNLSPLHKNCGGYGFLFQQQSYIIDQWCHLTVVSEDTTKQVMHQGKEITYILRFYFFVFSFELMKRNSHKNGFCIFLNKQPKLIKKKKIKIFLKVHGEHIWRT